MDRRWAICLTWMGLLVASLPAAAHLRSRLQAAGELRNTESALVDVLLREEFASTQAETAILVARGLPTDPAGMRSALRLLADTLRSAPRVTGALTYLDGEDPLLLGEERGSAIIMLGVDTRSVLPDSLVVALRSLMGSLAPMLAPPGESASPPSLRWTGKAPLSVDLRHASAAHARRAELRSLPLTLVLLLLAFGSMVAAVLPLLFGVGAILVAMGAAASVTLWWAPSIMLENVVSILGLALGIDYALLFVTRFREALAQGRSPQDASAWTRSRAGHTVILSGSTVAVGFAALLLVPIDEIRSIALGGALTVLAAVLLATTLLPAPLSWLGTRINRGRLWAPSDRAPDDGPWVRWGRFVVRHPIWVLLVAGFPLLILGAQAFRLSTLVPQSQWLPQTMGSAQALQDLEELHRARLSNIVAMVLELPPSPAATANRWWEAAGLVSARAAGDPRISRVRSLPDLAASYPVPPSLFLMMLPDSVRKEFVTENRQFVRFDLIPEEKTTIGELATLVRELRRIDWGSVTGVEGARMRVGGIPAYQVDYEDSVARYFPLVFLLVVGGIFLALAVGFHSVLVPLKATVLNLLSVGAAFGALVLVFQDGWGIRLFGLDEPLTGVFPAVPILAFAIVFGLSMDYEVFLVGRVAEERRSRPGAPEEKAIVAGLACTARLITSAAAIMVAIFAAFSFGTYLPAKLLGFGLAVAVLVDATLVRLAIGPALLQLAGRWNWWPGDGASRNEEKRGP